MEARPKVTLNMLPNSNVGGANGIPSLAKYAQEQRYERITIMTVRPTNSKHRLIKRPNIMKLVFA